MTWLSQIETVAFPFLNEAFTVPFTQPDNPLQSDVMIQDYKQLICG